MSYLVIFQRASQYEIARQWLVVSFLHNLTLVIGRPKFSRHYIVKQNLEAR